MRKTFDFEQALKAVQSSQAVPGKDGVLAPLVKPRTEAALEGELDSPLADGVAGNRGNGHATAFPLRLAGCDPLHDPRPGPLPDESRAHRAGAEQGRQLGDARLVAVRERQLLVLSAHGSAESGRRRPPDPLRGRLDGLSRGDGFD